MPEESVGRWTFAFLANHLVSENGLLHALGAGWTQITVQALPVAHVVYLGAQAIDVPDGGVIGARLLDPADNELASSSTLVYKAVQDAPGWMMPTTILALSFPVMFTLEGEHRVVLSGSAGDAEVRFQVRLIHGR